MMATTLEAIIATVFFDSGANSLDAVRAVMDNLGFLDHPLLQVTYCDPGSLHFEDRQMITDVQSLVSS
jgi:hypothetical protein